MGQKGDSKSAMSEPCSLPSINCEMQYLKPTSAREGRP